ncbi:MAG: hypothetical protein WEC81_01750 [Patescibacteria group bacterium]
MVIELSDLQGTAVRSATGQMLGKVDFAVFNGKEATLLGFQIARPGVVKKFAGLYFADLIDIARDELVIENDSILKPNLRDFDQAYKNFGPVVGVNATTQSGIKLGKVADLYLDLTTGGIIRFYVRHLLNERIIPQQYLIAITPEQIVFNDVVGEPMFEKTATQAAQS